MLSAYIVLVFLARRQIYLSLCLRREPCTFMLERARIKARQDFDPATGSRLINLVGQLVAAADWDL